MGVKYDQGKNVGVAGNVVGIYLLNPFEKQAGGMSCLENVNRGESETQP